MRLVGGRTAILNTTPITKTRLVGSPSACPGEKGSPKCSKTRRKHISSTNVTAKSRRRTGGGTTLDTFRAAGGVGDGGRPARRTAAKQRHWSAGERCPRRLPSSRLGKGGGRAASTGRVH